MAKLKGVVSSVKVAPDQRKNTYTIISDRPTVLMSDTVLDINDVVEVNNVVDGIAIRPKLLGRSTAKDYDSRISILIAALGLEENISRTMQKSIGKPYYDSLNMMMPSIRDAGISFLRSFLGGAPVVVRFHNDGDGASGAVALHRALAKVMGMCFSGERSVAWCMHRGVEYDQESLRLDEMVFSSFKSIEKPLVFITDFGTAQGSESSIHKAASKYKLIWLDHHPIYEGFPREAAGSYINSWDFGLDSNFTAGLLTCIFAECLADVYTDDMKNASLISDYSTYANRLLKTGQRDAIILDYLTSVAGRRGSSIERLTPSYIDSVLASREMSESVFSNASNTLSELLELGTRSVKKHRCAGGITAFVLDFEAMPRGESGFPLPGRYTSRLQERMESVNGQNTITIVYYGSYITIRLAKQISSSVGLLKIINRLINYEDYVQSGGGHNEAASIKVKEGCIKNVLNLLLKELDKLPDAQPGTSPQPL